MSKEMQIEEIAQFCCNTCEMFTHNTVGANKFPCALDNDYKSCHLCIETAEHLYNAGYRKQSDGEWIKHPASYECTACKEEFSVEGYAEDYDPITDWDLHFCPNCGAKMKGGETDA